MFANLVRFGQLGRLAGVPALILLDSDGKEISRESFMNSPELVKLLNSPE